MLLKAKHSEEKKIEGKRGITKIEVIEGITHKTEREGRNKREDSR